MYGRVEIKWLKYWTVLDDSGKAAFQKYLNLGGNFIGIHAASDCLRNTTFYGKEVGASFPLNIEGTITLNSAELAEFIGAWFDYHPEIQTAVSLSLSCHVMQSMYRVLDRRCNWTVKSKHEHASYAVAT